MPKILRVRAAQKEQEWQEPERSPVQPVERGGYGLAEVALEAPGRLVWLLLRDPSHLNGKEHDTLSLIRVEGRAEDLYDLAQSYVKIVRGRDVEAFDPWLEHV